WNASLSYVRSTQFLAAFSQPLLSDAVNAGVSGLLAPRVNVLADSGVARGTVGFSGSHGFASYHAMSTMQVAITRNLALFGQYAFYRYQVPVALALIPLQSQFSRHTVTAGLTVFVPLVEQRRSDGDTR